MSSIEELKQLGNDAFKNGNNDDAIKHWSDAISQCNDNNDKDILKVLYSNRSGAYLKIKNKDNAIDDANKCISLDRSWTKGYIRKGDALHSQLKYVEAYNSYNEGSRLDSNDKSIKEKMETMMNLIARTSDQERQQRSSYASTTTSNNDVYVQAPGFMGKLQNYIRIFIIVSFIASMLPLRFVLDNRIISLIWRGFVLSSILSNVIALVSKYGTPKFSIVWFQKLVPEVSTSMCLLATLLLTCQRMYIFGSLPLLIHEANYFSGDIVTTFVATIKQQKTQVQGMIRQYMPSVNMDPEDLVRGLNKKTFLEAMGKLSAYSEVVQGIYLVIEVLLPSRNLLLVFLWWQFLKVRFLLDQSGNIRWAFGDIDRNILIAMNHKYCPGLVKSGYGFLKNYLEKQIKDVHQAAQQGGSSTAAPASFTDRMKKSCNIM